MEENMRSRTIVATPPGSTIREQLQMRGMSQKEFAQRMGLTQKHTSHVINGEVTLTPAVAMKLESVLDIPAEFWMNLEGIYRAKLLRAQEEEQMDDEHALLKLLPYNELAKLGWVEDTKELVKKICNLRRFFEVANLTLLDGARIPGIAYRKLTTKETIDYKLVAWSQKAKLEARKIQTRRINLQMLESILPQLRLMTMQDPKAFFPVLKESLSNCGVALVVLQHIGGSFLHGATFFDGDKIVLGVTIRGKDADKFWFSLFHEIGHILKGHIGKPEAAYNEETANKFAADMLIQPDQYASFVSHGDFSRKKVRAFAQMSDIDCGIVVGRLQNDKIIEHNQLNDLKIKYLLT
jgi:HTH-type transcriptional regulator/antitoxin HigA